MRGQAASFIFVAQVALAQVGAERTSVPGVCFRFSADDSFGLSDGSSSTLKTRDKFLVQVKSWFVCTEPVKDGKMVWSITMRDLASKNSSSSLPRPATVLVAQVHS